MSKRKQVKCLLGIDWFRIFLMMQRFNENIDFKVCKDVEVRFSDLDALGHVNNASYLSYMEEARLLYKEKIFPDLGYAQDFSLFPIILGDVYCRYVMPAFLGEVICVHLAVTKFGTKSFVIDYKLTEKKSRRVLALAQTTMVMFDFKTNVSYPIPQEIKNKICQIEGREID